ncbi:MAG: hypothetical protein OMM_05729 [Candidatus Magnetoglobus multicellularis str. Araruama]|uniref:Uncharacterized protein n=1 Tax=Candidatus Magnetoglobus multicellularis str. Araruama TaxID=890399 RepID=A0A1V1NUN5_9BACT|nr:MAG: hypothetical protein OMM_05729 [Candidatus Magnetoglobus multicellularis str. Araruama]
MTYYQNYDLVINWLSQAFKGKTLKIVGIDSAPIKRVCSYKPVEIAIHTGIIDVLFEDEKEQCYHMEEQRNMIEEDLYRFGTQHFSIAKEWRDNIIDIILISGKPYNGKREIKTKSGIYRPQFVDLTKRNRKQRFQNIRDAYKAGDTSLLLELVFLPMYGQDDAVENNDFIREVIQFELEVFKQEPKYEMLLAATLVMANKIIDDKTFNELWEEIKMIKVFEFAREKGFDEGYDKGKNDGRIEGYDKGVLSTARQMLLEVLGETTDVVPEYIEKKSGANKKSNNIERFNSSGNSQQKYQ